MAGWRWPHPLASQARSSCSAVSVVCRVAASSSCQARWSHFSTPPAHLLPAGVYAYNVSVQGGGSCIAAFNVTACPSTVTCAAARVVALPQANSCTDVALPLPSLYNVSTPTGPAPVVTVVPTLPSPLSFAPGESRPRACAQGGPFPGEVKRRLRRGRPAHGPSPLQTGGDAMCSAPGRAGRASRSRLGLRVLNRPGSHTAHAPCASGPPLCLAPRPRPPAGVYSYTVSVQGGSWCTTSITVTACHSTVTCAEPRTLALPQDGRCATYALTQSSIYNITVVPYGVFAATVFPALPSNLVFAPGEQDPLSVLVQQKGAVGRGHSSNPPL